MPTFYNRIFEPKNSKQSRSKHHKENGNMLPIPIKDVEDYMIRQLFKTKKKSLTNQRVSKK